MLKVLFAIGFAARRFPDVSSRFVGRSRSQQPSGPAVQLTHARLPPGLLQWPEASA